MESLLRLSVQLNNIQYSPLSWCILGIIHVKCAGQPKVWERKLKKCYISRYKLEDSGNYSCEVRASNNGIRKRSTEVPINVAIEGGTYTYLLIVVSMVVVVLLLLLIAATLYKCRQRRSPVFLSQEPMTDSMTTDVIDTDYKLYANIEKKENRRSLPEIPDEIDNIYQNT
ncbi:uncharacterized protein [Hyperolius riggenbachi]|uniref:uncharacterized protein isoform X4 n=1 Tax=Hyperolius riggenbachi TaxID=752182 RepID=UPI0035A265D7